MKKIFLITFEACPNAKKTKTLLDELGVAFTWIKQELLERDHPYQQYSSPSILRGDELVFGAELAKGSSGCSLELPSRELLQERLGVGKETKRKKKGKSAFLSSIGSFGAAFTVGFCPLCIPAVATLFSALGLGFLLHVAVLQSILVFFIFLTLLGLYWSYRKEHHRFLPFLAGLIMSAALYVGRYVFLEATLNQVLLYGGIVGMISVGIWNMLLRKQSRCSACASSSK
ncbi:MAG: hypothetical protein COV43_07750 [Deltaproteobacteria bacterium CG11_big_fil_rev_8_21_14_0_20_42_23]|nr:MAG: hypothetical protein COV43_07750 [Deltaproteobacteria bacterium CG11_big_fil_rev_8_21_14_0_20_42_23]PJC63445.1 MAG: hypothetical protein CO021_09370 [Deltaproteobacteria bacterium CG_4_9_14_0_2_um_filter_42_21]